MRSLRSKLPMVWICVSLPKFNKWNVKPRIDDNRKSSLREMIKLCPQKEAKNALERAHWLIRLKPVNHGKNTTVNFLIWKVLL